MTIKNLADHLCRLVGCVQFEYNGKSCGIDPLSISEYVMWYGEDDIVVDSIDDVIDKDFFDGKSIGDVWDNVTNIEY